MPLHHAALALLAGKPAHGYELKSSFELASGHQEIIISCRESV